MKTNIYLNVVLLGDPIGGLGYNIRTHPDNPDIMYVTDAYVLCLAI
jgi:hypothetical protein